MLTKPAGVFVQLLGGAAVIVGMGMLVSGTPAGLAAVCVGIVLLWLGRQTRPRA